MKIEKVSTRNGSYYSFVYYDAKSKKPIRLTKAYIRGRFGKDIIEEAEARKLLQTLEKEVVSRANEKRLRLGWHTEQGTFSELVALYEIAHKKSAPNSYQNTMHYLRYYVCHFFLQLEGSPNPEEWVFHYDAFKTWLEEKATITRTPGKPLAYNSKNHCIHALNTFLRFLHRKQIIERFTTCPQFPTYQMKEKSVDDLISQEEMETICAHLHKKGDSKSSTFLRLLYFTGMRYNEAKGLSLNDIYEGALDDPAFSSRMSEHQIPYYGYLVIDSQPVRKSSPRNREGHIPRKPLKGRKKIDEKSARTIPIIDEILWKELAFLYNESLRELKRGIWGNQPSNYLLFENAERKTIKKAYQTLCIPYHSPHCCRHSRATLLIGETGDAILTRMWLGHTSQKVLDKYVHIYQACVRKAKKGVQMHWKEIEIPC